MNCEFCQCGTSERLVANFTFEKGLPIEGMRVNACPDCTGKAVRKIADHLDAQIADMPRRRGILALNLELKELQARGASEEEIEANREEKRALVGLRTVDARGLSRAMRRLSGGKVSA